MQSRRGFSKRSEQEHLPLCHTVTLSNLHFRRKPSVHFPSDAYGTQNWKIPCQSIEPRFDWLIRLEELIISVRKSRDCNVLFCSFFWFDNPAFQHTKMYHSRDGFSCLGGRYLACLSCKMHRRPFVFKVNVWLHKSDLRQVL